MHDMINTNQLKKLKQLQEQYEKQSDDRAYLSDQIQKIIGDPHYVETHQDGLFYRDDLYIWTDPNHYIIVSYLSHFSDIENTEFHVKIYENSQEYKKYLLSIKQRIELSPHFNIEKKGSFSTLLSPFEEV